MVITFLSYNISDKAMAWIILNAFLIGTYIYEKQSKEMMEHFNKVCDSVTEMSRKILEKIPKEKEKDE